MGAQRSIPLSGGPGHLSSKRDPPRRPNLILRGSRAPKASLAGLLLPKPRCDHPEPQRNRTTSAIRTGRNQYRAHGTYMTTFGTRLAKRDPPSAVPGVNNSLISEKAHRLANSCEVKVTNLM